MGRIVRKLQRRMNDQSDGERAEFARIAYYRLQEWWEEKAANADRRLSEQLREAMS